MTEAEELTKRAQIHRVPVVDGQNRLAGVLSLNDIALAWVNPDLGDGVEPTEVASTLAAICAHRGLEPARQSPQRRRFEARA